ncbi:SHOCT domain-containing protein [Rhizobium halophytocola]|uniref:SHOCT domain-containing protein n=1 Tax=Rhizobium halophytocola TaxID=735519 RepID=A0ABS4DWY3_9HYPH|nr:SHOCT domain-containing protein [Rhizobium halophytocola]MBP1850199.1 hypothetical protein [Rhizobium halophytocola]
MTALSEQGRKTIGEIAARHAVSLEAAEHMLLAVMAGHGNQAQFNHPDLGGMGQWSLGGMTMVGDMFNNGLKARVDALCSELSSLARNGDLLAASPGSHQSQSQSGGGYSSQSQGGSYPGGQSQGQGYAGGAFQGGSTSGGGASLFVPGSFQQNGGWPAELGHAASTGAQNDLRYAVFPDTRRLAIDLGGKITVYDTGDHRISGFSQQQSGDQSLTFTSQYGLVRVGELPVVGPAVADAAEPPPAATAPDMQAPDPGLQAQAPAPRMAENTGNAAPATVEDDIFAKIEKLAALHGRGILTDDEYQAKKAELLARL